MDVNYNEDDKDANGITYTVDIHTRNYKLNDGQRAALREAMVQVLTELSIKMDLVVGEPNACRVKGSINAANSGAREIIIPEGGTAPQENAEPIFSIGGVTMKD